MTEHTQSIPIATRPSILAQAQTQYVIEKLRQTVPDVECHTVFMTTQGDQRVDQPLPEIGGKGVFTQELEQAIRFGEVRAAVHSLKDLPVEDPVGLTVGAVLARTDGRDVLVARVPGTTLQTLPAGACVGTSSLRRAAQGRALRPDLRFESVRGNVNTRLRKMSEGFYDALFLAGIGLQRLGLEGAISEWLPLEVMLPAPGQGALAVQCRKDDVALLEMLRTINDLETSLATMAERAFLKGLGGGCSLPVAAYATVEGEEITLRTKVLSLDGTRTISLEGCGPDPDRLGLDLARKALDLGAERLLSHGE